MLILALPAPSLAATSRPTCTLRVTTPDDTVSIRKTAEVLVVRGDSITIDWSGKDAQSARTGDVSVPVQGSSTFVASKSERLSYRFANGSRSATCAADIEVVSATVDPLPAGEGGERMTLSGTVSGTRSVRVTVTRDGDSVVSSKVKARRNRWQVTLRRDLADGAYRVAVYGTEGDLRNRELASSTFRIGAPATTLAASPIALLFGGTARANGSIPVAYVKIANAGAVPATIAGFDLVQNGNAPASVITGFSTSDDKGGSLSTLGASFQANRAFVPLLAVIGPGQFRIFTVKALLGANAGAFSGTQLKLDVAGVRSDAPVVGIFPMRGTTWTLTR